MNLSVWNVFLADGVECLGKVQVVDDNTRVSIQLDGKSVKHLNERSGCGTGWLEGKLINKDKA
jgi:hypothetical protein